uniref:Ulp1 protease family, C-terminal catalytic domain containing protein n=1 Tax=Solanum tuberosum TaxID=4113 RepID=M1C435_SOLTU
MNAIDQNNLHQSSSHHETENQATSERNNVDFDEKYVELKKEIAEDDARQHVEESEKASMDQPSVSMREYVDNSNTDDMSINPNMICIFTYKVFLTFFFFEYIAEVQNSIDQTVGVVFNADIPGSSTSKPSTLDDYPNLTMTQIVELDPILNANTTPDVKPRNRNPSKYDTSPYIRLSEAELIDEFNKWVFKNVLRGRYLNAYDSMRGGSVYTKKVNEAVGKLATMIPLFFMSTKFYGKRLDLYANKLSKYVDKSQSNPLEVKHMMLVPQQKDSSNDCGLYTCIFAEYISNGVFDMRSVDIYAKYHRQRYATIIWHYGKIKNEDGAISESEVTGTVARKFGGPRIAKEHVPDTSNYPTPR